MSKVFVISATVWVFTLVSYTEGSSLQLESNKVDRIGPPTRYFPNIDRYQFSLQSRWHHGSE